MQQLRVNTNSSKSLNIVPGPTNNKLIDGIKIDSAIPRSFGDVHFNYTDEVVVFNVRRPCNSPTNDITFFTCSSLEERNTDELATGMLNH